MAIIENQTQWLCLKAVNKWMCRQLFLPNMVQHCLWCLVLDSHFLDVRISTFFQAITFLHVSGFISWSRVGKLSSWRTPLFAGNASASLRTFFPPFISALAITSQLSRLLFGSNLNWNIRPPPFFCNLLDLGFDAPEVYSTKINWGLNCLKISELEHFCRIKILIDKKGKGNCYESLLSHAPISPLWTDQGWHWAKPRLAKLPAFSILSAKLTANRKLTANTMIK